MLENKNASAINASVVLKRTLVIVSILLTIAFIHVLDVEAWLPRDWRGLYSSYFSDLALPFGFYFLLCANQVQRPFLRPWTVKAGLFSPWHLSPSRCSILDCTLWELYLTRWIIWWTLSA